MDADVCAICLGEKSKERESFPKCRHTFCRSCVDDMRGSAECARTVFGDHEIYDCPVLLCPLCRAPHPTFDQSLRIKLRQAEELMHKGTVALQLVLPAGSDQAQERSRECTELQFQCQLLIDDVLEAIDAFQKRGYHAPEEAALLIPAASYVSMAKYIVSQSLFLPGPGKNTALGLAMLTDAAESGLRMAQIYIADVYRTGGNGVGIDLEKAMHFYEKVHDYIHAGRGW